ncbi:hypothetical protein Hdeb2414_s0381g00881381 [Helianthus debilis subsp. tardiflorus]
MLFRLKWERVRKKSWWFLGRRKSWLRKVALLPSMARRAKVLKAWSVTRLTKGMQEYEEASKKKDKIKASMATMKKEVEGFSKKEEAWVKKVGELTKRHEIEVNDLKKSFEAGRLKLKADREALEVQQRTFEEEKEGLKGLVAQATGDNQWLIE